VFPKLCGSVNDSQVNVSNLRQAHCTESIVVGSTSFFDGKKEEKSTAGLTLLFTVPEALSKRVKK